MTTSTVLTTSLAQIRSFQPCAAGWMVVVKANSQRDIQESFPLKNTVQSNTFSDVCWLLGKLGIKSVCIKAAQMCADSVAHLNNWDAADAAAYAADADAADADATAAYAAEAAKAVAEAAEAAEAAAATYAAEAADAAAAKAAKAATYAATAAKKEQRLKNKAFLLLAIELYEQGVLS